MRKYLVETKSDYHGPKSMMKRVLEMTAWAQRKRIFVIFLVFLFLAASVPFPASAQSRGGFFKGTVKSIKNDVNQSERSEDETSEDEAEADNDSDKSGDVQGEIDVGAVFSWIKKTLDRGVEESERAEREERAKKRAQGSR